MAAAGPLRPAAERSSGLLRSFASVALGGAIIAAISAALGSAAG
jgi:hypothetical protein